MRYRYNKQPYAVSQRALMVYGFFGGSVLPVILSGKNRPKDCRGKSPVKIAFSGDVPYND